MNNEPVAWMNKINEEWVTTTPDDSENEWIPLYTHPAKELTDEEIKQTFQEQTGFYFDDNPADDLALMDFARAILRKAQEK